MSFAIFPNTANPTWRNGGSSLAERSVATAVSAYGASLKPKLANIAISGAPEDQLRGPLEALIKELAEIGGFSTGTIQFVGETALSDIKTRPDFAVTVSKALIGSRMIRSIRNPNV